MPQPNTFWPNQFWPNQGAGGAPGPPSIVELSIQVDKMYSKSIMVSEVAGGTSVQVDKSKSATVLVQTEVSQTLEVVKADVFSLKT